MPKKLIIKKGDKFGKLSVIQEVVKKTIKRRFLLLCECGNKKKVDLNSLRVGNVTSCGCVALRAKTIHGMSGTRLYRIYYDIKSRCLNSNDTQYFAYGAREITICDEWKDNRGDFFKWALENGYKEDLSIDRIDSFGNYEPHNCRWATRTQQSRNTPRFKKGISGVRGVSYCNTAHRWRATISINNKGITIGRADTINECAILRNKYILDNNLDHITSELL